MPSHLLVTSCACTIAIGFSWEDPALQAASQSEALCRKMLSQRSEDLAGCQQCEVEHTQEGSTWEKLGRLLNDVRAYARQLSHLPIHECRSYQGGRWTEDTDMSNSGSL